MAGKVWSMLGRGQSGAACCIFPVIGKGSFVEHCNACMNWAWRGEVEERCASACSKPTTGTPGSETGDLVLCVRLHVHDFRRWLFDRWHKHSTSLAYFSGVKIELKTQAFHV
jgi:hypothetical protein